MRILPYFFNSSDINNVLDYYRAARSRAYRTDRGYTAFKVPRGDLSSYVGRCLGELDAETEAWDAFMLHYEDGQGVETHVDERTIRRLNVLVRAPEAGGVLTIDGADVSLLPGDGIIFESCRQPHSVSPCQGDRIIFSVGLVRRG
jgi:hypothetical protein